MKNGTILFLWMIFFLIYLHEGSSEKSGSIIYPLHLMANGCHCDTCYTSQEIFVVRGEFTFEVLRGGKIWESYNFSGGGAKSWQIKKQLNFVRAFLILFISLRCPCGLHLK